VTPKIASRVKMIHVENEAERTVAGATERALRGPLFHSWRGGPR
jgi:hypothetical protein